MATRTRHPNIRVVADKTTGSTADDVIEPKPVFPALPVLVSSVFCDDLRMEASGKIIMVGCYPGNVIMVTPGQPVEQLWVFAKLSWREDFDPAGLRLRLEAPAREPGTLPVQSIIKQSDRAGENAVCIWLMRFHPLRVGDLLRVSLENDKASMPCGELLAVAPSSMTRH